MQFRPGVLLKMFRDARQQSLSLRWKLAVWLIMLGLHTCGARILRVQPHRHRQPD